MNPVRQLLSLMSLAIVAAALSVVAIKAPAAADSETSAAGSQDTERLACLEAIANPVGDQASGRRRVMRGA